jgi:two-component system nitrate/nitrite sensor histidine kinase NarX
MAASLDDMYRSLEDKVHAKTRHLEDVQEGLRFLYDCSRRLSGQGNLVEKLERTVNQLQRHLQADHVDLLLMHESPEHPFHISTARQADNPAGPYMLARAGTDLTDFEQFPLQHDNRTYGYLQVFLSGTPEFDKEQHLILTAVADTIGAALANEARKDQEHRVALMDERAAIARELHDSLAQSLSFTKIQISRFQALQQKNAPPDQLEDALEEIKAGIQAAYGQLRELLVTFRLQLDSPGLQESLASTAQEFEDRGNLSIDLNYDLQNYPLTPNEEIHILQIVREALSNVLRHSGANSASIHLAISSDSGMIEISVIDNGCGFNAAASGRNHYGQTIMRERAKILGGTIEFIDRKDNGAQVRVRFQAEQRKQQAQQFKALGR